MSSTTSYLLGFNSVRKDLKEFIPYDSRNFRYVLSVYTPNKQKPVSTSLPKLAFEIRPDSPFYIKRGHSRLLNRQ